jgi:ABC-type branched-subunit amino acid transport system ATPase component
MRTNSVAAQADQAQHSAALLELRNIQKWFGGVHALRGIDLTLHSGEAYHLLGENGCGKSTVIKIMSGAHAPTSGEIVLGGETFPSLTPIQSLRAGIETVYQDLSLLPNLTVAENVALSEQLVDTNGRLARLFDRKRLKDTAEKALTAAGLPTDRAFLNTIVSDLPLASRQLVAIARAIATRAKLVIMDEPTTSLTRREVDNLVRVVERLRSENVAVLFVTHKLDECYRIGGHAVVFRDGQCVAQGPIETYSKKQLAELMTGRSIDAQRYRTGKPSDVELLKVDRLVADGVRGGKLFCKERRDPRHYRPCRFRPQRARHGLGGRRAGNRRRDHARRQGLFGALPRRGDRAGHRLCAGRPARRGPVPRQVDLRKRDRAYRRASQQCIRHRRPGGGAQDRCPPLAGHATEHHGPRPAGRRAFRRATSSAC